MARSLALGLYLLLAERGKSADVAARPARPEVAPLWLHVGRATRAESLRQILRLVARNRPDLPIVVTHGPDFAPDLPSEVIRSCRLHPHKCGASVSLARAWSCTATNKIRADAPLGDRDLLFEVHVLDGM